MFSVSVKLLWKQQGTLGKKCWELHPSAAHSGYTESGFTHKAVLQHAQRHETTQGEVPVGPQADLSGILTVLRERVILQAQLSPWEDCIALNVHSKGIGQPALLPHTLFFTDCGNAICLFLYITVYL